MASDPNDPVTLLPGIPSVAQAEGHLLFSECTSPNAGANCNPHSAGEPAGSILAGGRAYIILHTDGKNYVLLEGLKGGPFTTVEYGALCSLEGPFKVTGSIVAECGKLEPAGTFVQVDCKIHQVKQLLRQAPQALFPNDVLKFGINAALLDGIAAVELNGAHAGQAWSGEV